jgi:hypothetical protein
MDDSPSQPPAPSKPKKKILRNWSSTESFKDYYDLERENKAEPNKIPSD